MKRTDIFQGHHTAALGADLSSVKCKGKWLPLEVTVDALTGMTLSIDRLSGAYAQSLKEWLAPIIEAVDARVLVTDDADALKAAADQNGVYQQICKSHVGRNTDTLVEQLQASLVSGFNQSLDDIGASVQQALADLQRLKELIHQRQPEARSELESMAQRYQEAKSPSKGQSANLAYRLPNLLLDRWNLWPHLTFYREWKDALLMDGFEHLLVETLVRQIQRDSAGQLTFETILQFKHARGHYEIYRTLLDFTGN
jgi:hypothetical protein